MCKERIFNVFLFCMLSEKLKLMVILVFSLGMEVNDGGKYTFHSTLEFAYSNTKSK